MTTISSKYTEQEAAEMLERYPYFTLPALLALKRGGTHGPLTDRLAARVAISLSDKESLSQVLGQQASMFDNFYPEEQKSTPGTLDTIDTFLSTFGKSYSRETDALEKMIFNPAPDYASVLAAEERASLPGEQELTGPDVSEQDRLINSFIAGNNAHIPDRRQEPVPVTEALGEEELKSEKLTNEEPKTEQTPVQARKEPENATLTESLVRVLIKNRNYSKAIEIISDLSLKNPEKSIYFADHIRFLRKLIINENKK